MFNNIYQIKINLIFKGKTSSVVDHTLDVIPYSAVPGLTLLDSKDKSIKWYEYTSFLVTS